MWAGHGFGKVTRSVVEVPDVEQRSFEQMQKVYLLAVGEVNLVPQERVRQLVGKLRNQLMEVSEVQQWTFEQVQVVDGLAGGKDRTQQPFC